MLAFVPGNEGDRGKWGASGDAFHTETVTRGISQPSDFWRDNSLLLSLTAPYGDYSELNTYTLIFNQHFSEGWIELLSYGDAPNGGYRNDFVDPSSTYSGPWVQEEDFDIETFDTGVTMDEVPWLVQLAYDPDLRKWFVVVDGSFGDIGYTEKSEAERIAQIKVTLLNQRKSIDPPIDPTIPILPVAIGGSIILVVVVLLVAVYGFSKGKGGM